MEFSPRGFQRNPSRPPTPSDPDDEARPSAERRPKQAFAGRALAHVKNGSAISKLSVVLSAGLLILGLSIILGIAFMGAPSEARAVDKDNYQVVALTDGQAYFGRISALTGRYIELSDVFYLNSQGTGADDNVQLIKRGCEVHGPQDSMRIYRDQVNFWENLRSDGRVSTAIAQWKEQNPNGQDCSTQTTTPPAPQGQGGIPEGSGSEDSGSGNGSNNDRQQPERPTPPPAGNNSDGEETPTSDDE